jgi:chorismate-pyruvate lyase
MNKLKSLFMIVVMGSLFACSTTGSKSDKEHSFEAFLNNKNPISPSLKKLNKNFSVEILKNGVLSNNYERISSLKLENTPVVVSSVTTNIANTNLVSILRSASTTPIGVAVKKSSLDIDRSNMVIKIGTVKDVKNELAHKYINELAYNDNVKIIIRSSEYKYKSEQMFLTEYVLPSMAKYFVN